MKNFSFLCTIITFSDESVGMDGVLTERRLSSGVALPWLDQQQQQQQQQAAEPSVDRSRIERSPGLEGEDGYPPNKIQVQNYDVPRIQVPGSSSRHRSGETFADTEVEELLAMLRETESLEEQGDILQYLVDTQGLDFNTGSLECFFFSGKLRG